MNKATKKTKNQNNVTTQKKKLLDTNIQNDENDLNYNPFTTKETIKPFDLDIEDDKIEKTEHRKGRKNPFKELLKKRIQEMNAKVEQTKENRDDETETFENEIEKFGKEWYEKNLVNDVPRKLTIM
ncbi:hypothetical protein [Plasmodium yoelii yoelii]|uniref:Uncharacterized protein n=2 Tax=Plasmodium yoelii TaxID=5861 RepID=Q7RA03_PLAYO|nr:hypothetical protein [Plasmodium yoelii yoelii]